MPTCYSHYHLNLPKPIRSWFPGRLVPPFVVTTGRTESLPGRVEHGVCGSLGSCGPWPGSGVGRSPFHTQPYMILPEPAAVDFRWSSFPSSPKATWYQPSIDSCPPALPAPWSCTSLGDKSQSQAKSQPLSQELAEGSG